MKSLLLLVIIIGYVYSEVCEAVGDPHMKTFYGQRYDFMKEGDYFMVQSAKFSVQIRNRHWGQNAMVVTGVAMKFQGHRVVVKDSSFMTLNVDGKDVALRRENGIVLTLSHGVNVQRINANRIKVISKQRYVDIIAYVKPVGDRSWPQDHYFNVYVSVPTLAHSKYWKGACMTNNVNNIEKVTPATTDFENSYTHHHKGPRRHICTEEALANAKVRCRAKKFEKESHYEMCVVDVCHGLHTTNIEESIEFSHKRQNMRESDLEKLMKRVQEASKYKKLSELTSVNLAKMDERLNSLTGEYKNCLIEESSKRKELRQLFVFEKSFKLEITKYERFENQAQSALKLIQSKRSFIERELRSTYRKEKRTWAKVQKIKIEISQLRSQLSSLRSSINYETKSQRRISIRIKQIQVQIETVIRKIRKQKSFLKRYRTKIVIFRQRKVYFETELRTLVAKEEQVSDMMKDITALKNEMFHLSNKRENVVSKKAYCIERLKKFQEYDITLVKHLREYETQLQEKVTELKRYYKMKYNQELEWNKHERRRKQLKIEVRQLEIKIKQTYKEKESNEKQIRHYQSEESKYKNRISSILLKEIQIKKDIKFNLDEITRWKIELSKNTRREDIVTSQLKTITRDCEHVKIVIEKVKVEYETEKKKYDFYYKSYVDNLDAPTGPIDCAKMCPIAVTQNKKF